MTILAHELIFNRTVFLIIFQYTSDSSLAVHTHNLHILTEHVLLMLVRLLQNLYHTRGFLCISNWDRHVVVSVLVISSEDLSGVMT